MLKKLILITSILVGPQALADRCLENASNSELLLEVSRRMDSNGSGQGLNNLSIYCNGYHLVVSLVDANGQEKMQQTGLSTASECSRQLELIGRTSNYRAGRVLNFCASYTMLRMQVRSDDIVQLNPVSFSTQSECEVQARNANQP
jgi:hypothetical protein